MAMASMMRAMEAMSKALPYDGKIEGNPHNNNSSGRKSKGTGKKAKKKKGKAMIG